jgi:pyruvate/2-oxoglutarate dehydrogenase complex dihydrolipoamide dehydrogenase (E3) component
MSYQYQVVVVGSGSAGKEACLKAAKAGLRTLLIEDRTLGGTAYYAGSYAVRALRACASYLNQTEKASKVGTNLDLIESSWTNWLTSQRLGSGKLGIEFSSRAAEKINLVATAIANGLTALDISKLSAVHPSATEVLVRVLRNHFDSAALE